MTKRIGPKMKAALWFVERFPGCIAYDAAKYLAPGNQFGRYGSGFGYGYDTIGRALKADLIREGTCTEARCTRPNKVHRHLWAKD